MDTEFGVKTLRAVLAGGVLALALATPSYAVDLPVAVSTVGLFELDGNTVDEANDLAAIPPILGKEGDDWSDLKNGSGLHNGGISTFLTDSAPKVFTSGSKDIGDIGTWHWSNGPSPNKADIQNAYAAAYIDPATKHLILYFGADRAATNGTVATGFWFFKNPITTNPDGSFSGQHAAEGDTLVAVNYSSGGAVGTIAVYEWTGGQLVPRLDVGNAALGLFCTSDKAACAITNGSGITTSWTGNGPLKPGQFFEGGIDLSALVPGSTCFSSFMAMSRSSTTTNAELKNFVFGNFRVCDYKVSKTCDAVVKKGSNYQYTVSGKITNTGFGPVTATEISDTPNPDTLPAFSSATFNFTDYDATTGNCGTTPKTLPFTLTSGQTACYTGTVEDSAQVDYDTITVAGTFLDIPGTQTRTASNEAVCPTLQTGSLTVTNSCTVSIENDGTLRVNVTAEVRNSGQAAVSNVQVNDSLASLFTPSNTTLAAGSGPATFKRSYAPSSASTSIYANTHCAAFTVPGVTATGTDPTGSISSGDPVSATCGVCPATECPLSTAGYCTYPPQ